jgi:hypothetical protein
MIAIAESVDFPSIDIHNLATVTGGADNAFERVTGHMANFGTIGAAGGGGVGALAGIPGGPPGMATGAGIGAGLGGLGGLAFGLGYGIGREFRRR